MSAAAEPARIPGHPPERPDAAPGRAATPLYLTLAKTLMDAIQAGVYPVGSLLPTEVDLARLYGVSRQTVRQAIAQLRQQNVLFARKGVGTRVEAGGGARPFSYSASSVNELLELAQESAFAIETSESVVARAGLANLLGCRTGHRWLHLAGPRTLDGEARPLAWVDVFVSGRIAQQLRIPPTLRTALFRVIEKQTGNTIAEIRQEIRAAILDARTAERIEAGPGAAALEITRRYYSTGRRLVLVSVNTMPADRFFYAVSIKPG